MKKKHEVLTERQKRLTLCNAVSSEINRMTNQIFDKENELRKLKQQHKYLKQFLSEGQPKRLRVRRKETV